MASPQPRACVHTPLSKRLTKMPARSNRAVARKASKPATASTKGLGKLPEWDLTRALCRDRRSVGEARPRSRRPLQHRLRGGFQGQARRPGGRPRCRQASSPRRSSATSSSTICSAGSRPMPGLVHAQRHGRSGAREILRRRAGATDRRLDASAVLRARAQPPRRRDARSGHGRSRARLLPALARGHPQGQALSARGPRRAALPREIGDRLFGLEPAVRRDHRAAALQGRHQVAGDRADAQAVAGSAARTSARRRRRRWR